MSGGRVVYVVTSEPYHDNSEVELVTDDLDAAVAKYREVEATDEWTEAGLVECDVGGTVRHVCTVWSSSSFASLDDWLRAEHPAAVERTEPPVTAPKETQ